MRQPILLATAIAGMLVSGAAFAESSPQSTAKMHHENQDTDATDMGVITAIDAGHRAITLADGNTYVVPGYVEIRSFTQGERVTVTYAQNPRGQIATVETVNAL